MVRFPEFEALGLRLAGITEAADGDFARVGGRPPEDALALAGVHARHIATVRQAHGTRVVIAESAGLSGLADAEADGIVTQDPTVAIAVRVADCVPVFLYDPETRTAGIVHAGRQGTYDGAVATTVHAMRERFGVVPGNVRALIGPSAGPCCYEVSEALAEGFRERGLPAEGRHLDLWEANARQLREAGVPRGQITVSGECTICVYRFHSYRATGTAARNLAAIAL